MFPYCIIHENQKKETKKTKTKPNISITERYSVHELKAAVWFYAVLNYKLIFHNNYLPLLMQAF